MKLFFGGSQSKEIESEKKGKKGEARWKSLLNNVLLITMSNIIVWHTVMFIMNRMLWISYRRSLPCDLL